MKHKKNREVKKVFTSLETILLVIISLIVGTLAGSLLKKSNIFINTSTQDEYINKFIKNYNYIVDNYYESVDKDALINGAIEGMTNALGDPYSTYFDEDSSDNFTITLNGSYEGLGLQIGKLNDSGDMMITSIFEDSPAKEAGLKVGDIIVSANGMKAADATTAEFSSYIREGKEKNINMVIIRDGQEMELTVQRKTVIISSISSNIINVDSKKVGYIYIGIFANNTYDQFLSKLKDLERENIDYLIIDVRGNSGGHLTAVKGILNIFLTKKQVLYKMQQGNKITPTYGIAKSNKKYEIILLGDGDSASASEVLISSLKENLNSKFFGKKTYGKGTVQELVDVSSDIQYKITTKKWLTPKGNWINDTKGIEPDYEVELDEKYFETGNQEDDSQLNAVINYIKEK